MNFTIHLIVNESFFGRNFVYDFLIGRSFFCGVNWKSFMLIGYFFVNFAFYSRKYAAYSDSRLCGFSEF